jgi:hypothetical protein
MKELDYRPLSAIDNLVRTLMMVGAILMGSLIIANPTSWMIKVALVSLVFGFLSFTLASQFLVTIEMGNAEKRSVYDDPRDIRYDDARDARVGISFFLGYVAYIIAGIFMCLNFVLR